MKRVYTRKDLIEVFREIHKLINDDTSNTFSRGWDNAVTICEEVFTQKTGIGVDDLDHAESAPENDPVNHPAHYCDDSPRWKGVVTASALNVRSWAGMEYGNIKAVPILHYGDPVEVCDTLRSEAGEKWYFVRIGGKIYGFVHGDFITRA